MTLWLRRFIAHQARFFVWLEFRFLVEGRARADIEKVKPDR